MRGRRWARLGVGAGRGIGLNEKGQSGLGKADQLAHGSGGVLARAAADGSNVQEGAKVRAWG
jgi:hypothetical protein